MANSSKIIIKLVVSLFSICCIFQLFHNKKTFNVCFCQLFLHCTSDMPHLPFIQPIVTIFFRRICIQSTSKCNHYPIWWLFLWISVLSMTTWCILAEFYSLLTTFFPHHSFFPPALLRYDWQIKIIYIEMYNVMFWYI